MSQPDRSRFRMSAYWIWLAVILAPGVIPAVIVEVSASLLAGPDCAFSFKAAGSGCDPQFYAIYLTSFLTLALTMWITLIGVPIWLATLGLRYLAWRVDRAAANRPES